MKYEVLVTRDASEYVVLEIEADSKETAAQAAIDSANNDSNVGWELNDNNARFDAYLGSGVDDDVTELENE